MDKISSILDYSYPSLDPAVFDKDLKLYEYQRDFILRILDKMYVTYNLKEPSLWVEDVVLLGSLCTSKWLLSSDMDIHIRVNLDNFIKANGLAISKEEAYAKLDEIRKLWDRAHILVPMSNHPIEAFFESIELQPSNVENVGVYSLLKNEWIKPPVLFPADLDLEESKKAVVEAAEALAEELDSSLGTIKRDIQRVNELETVIKAWDKEKQQLFYKKIETKLNNIEEEILKDIKIKQDLVDARHENMDATSDNELTFKWLQRFGFFGILSQLKKLLEQTGEVTVQELPLIEKIISEGSIEIKSELRGWLSPEGKFYKVNNHADWALEHAEEVGLDVKPLLDADEETGEPYEEQDWPNIGVGLQNTLISLDWSRVGDIVGGKGYGIEISDLYNVPSALFDFLLQNPLGNNIILEDPDQHWIRLSQEDIVEGQKAVNKALSHKRLQTASLDFDSWFAGSKVVDSNGKPLLCHHETNVDFKKVNPKKTTQGIFWFTTDRGSIDRGETGAAGHGMVKDFYVSMKNPAGWKEYEDLLLVQLKSQGYDGALLPKGDGTYDGFVFDNSQIWWVTPKKEASLHVVARAENIVWVAPNSKVFPVEGSHMGWVQSHSDILKQYGIESGVNDASGVERNEDLWDQMLRNGWVRLSDDFNEFIVDCYDMMDIPGIIEDIVLKEQPTMVRVEDLGHDIVLSEEDLSQGLRKAIVKALQQKRLQPVSSLKQAFLKEAFEEEKLVLAIDFDDTLAKENPDHSIGEPEPGAKEALIKLKNDGYTLEIYSHRANTDKGADEIKEWLEKYEIPYDSILNVEKPLATYYIDNRGIHFTNWADVLKQVEKSDKTASLHITAYDRAQAAYWVDPSGKVYPVKTTHEDWFFENEQLLRNQYHYDKDEIGQDWWDIKTGNLLNRLLEDGWLRVGDLFAAGRKSIGTGIEIADLNSISSTLIDFVSNWGKDKYFQIEDLQRRVVELSVEELVADGQEAVNRALQQEKMLSRRSALNLPVIDPKTLNRKEPYALFIGTQWDAKHTIPLDLFNIYPMANADNYVPTVGLQTLVEKNIPVIGKEPRAGDKQPAQDISGLYKQALKKEAAYSHAYWIDPHGKVFQVRGEGATAEGMNRGDFNTHSDWVRANIDMLVKEYGFKPKPAKSTELFSMPITSNDLIAADWIRIGDSSGGSEWGVTLKDINHIPQSVDNLLAQFVPEGAKITIEEDTSWQNSVQIEWPVNSVQLAVNQARRQQPVTAKLFSKKEIIARTSSDAWLMDPKGKLYPVVNDDHEETAQKLFHKSIYDLLPKGWVTIRTIGYNVAFSVDKFNRIPSTVDDYLARHSFNEVAVICSDGELEGLPEPPRVDYEDAIEYGIQKAINRDIMRMRNMPKTAQTKKVKQGDYSCLMALVPHDLAQEIVEFGVRTIPDGELYLDEDGKLGRELESHITIKYGLLTNDAKHVRRSFNDEKPFKAKLGKIKHFQPPELPFDVLTVEVISEDLEKANKRITDSFECAENIVDNDYRPHITIAYMKRDTAKDYIGSDIFEGKEIELDTVIFSPHKGNRTYFSISQDKESQFILEKINKFADYGPGNWAESAWISPAGKVIDLEGEIHEDVICELIGSSEIYNSNDPLTYAIDRGWTRFGEMGGGGETGANVKNIRSINPAVFNHAMKYTGQGKEMVIADLSGKYVHMPVDEFVLGQKAVNRALVGSTKVASGDNFLPSLVQPANNEWQFQHGGDDLEIAVDPDPINDETTFYGEWWDDKPRNKDVFRQFLSMFSKPFSKKEEMTVDSAYDPELEEAESKAMGEEPLLEYQKGFYDPKKHDFPHNTTWLNTTYQDQEPSKPLPVTYSPQLNEDNLDQNSPGGYPRRFMGKPKGEWFSNEGEVNDILINLFKNKEAAINSLTRDVTSSIELTEKGYWVDPSGKFYDVREGGGWNTHSAWAYTHRDELKEMYSDISSVTNNDYYKFLLDKGWVRIGDSFGADYGVQTANPFNLPSSVIDWINNNVHTSIRVDRWNTQESAIINLPVDDLQETINNEFKLQKLAPVAKKASSYGFGGWISPDGEFIKTKDHYKFVYDHPEIFGFNPSDVDTLAKISEQADKIINNGWIRIRSWGDSLLIQSRSFEDAKKAEAQIFEVLPDIKSVKIMLLDGQDFEATSEDFKEKGWDAFSRKPIVMAKQATIYNNYGGWISPEGKLISTSDHSSFLWDYPEVFGISTDGRDPRNANIWGDKAEKEVYDKGWVAVRVWDNKLYIFTNDYSKAHVAEDFIYSILNDLKSITVVRGDESAYTGEKLFATAQEFKEYGWEALKPTRKDIWANKKQAALLPQQPINENTNAGTAIMMDDGSIYFSDEPHMVHVKLIKRLGLPVEHIVSGGLIKDGVYYDQGVQTTDTMRYVEQQMAQKRVDEKIKQWKREQHKQAGDQSASVPDYLINEWKTDQINNDTDEEPYRTHDQRDYPYGMHDSPENTDSGIGWAKDNTTSVCLLDQLQNPADRNYPPGMPDYSIVFYEAMPMSDSLEATNPE